MNHHVHLVQSAVVLVKHVQSVLILVEHVMTHVHHVQMLVQTAQTPVMS